MFIQKADLKFFMSLAVKLDKREVRESETERGKEWEQCPYLIETAEDNFMFYFSLLLIFQILDIFIALDLEDMNIDLNVWADRSTVQRAEAQTFKSSVMAVLVSSMLHQKVTVH